MTDVKKEENEYQELQDELKKHYPGVAEMMEFYGKYRKVVEESGFYTNVKKQIKIVMSTNSMD